MIDQDVDWLRAILRTCAVFWHEGDGVYRRISRVGEHADEPGPVAYLEGPNQRYLLLANLAERELSFFVLLDRNKPKEDPVSQEPKRVVQGDIKAEARPASVDVDRPRAAPLVEDTSVIGGVDEVSGAPVIRPKAPTGRADESTRATDPRERHP